MALQQGLSGLAAASKALDVISNNVANSGTVGFKQAQTMFGDLYAASLASFGNNQVGIGATVGGVAQQFTQGDITSTGNSLDMAINGQGFFQLQSTSTGTTYSRNGQFQVDKSGYVVNSTGQQLMGITALPDGTSTGTVGPLQLNVSDASPKASLNAGFNLNLDSRSTTPTKLPSATLTGTALTLPVTVPAAPANTIQITVDAATTPTNVTIAPGTYTTQSSLVTAIQSAVDQTTLKGRVSVGLDATGNALTFSSERTGRLSSITVADSAASGTLASGVFNVSATPVNGLTNASFSTTDPKSYTSTTSQTVYDSLGNAHTLSMYFVKTAADNVWDVYTSLDGGFPPEIDPNTGVQTPWTVNFGSDGLIMTPTSATKSYALSNGATSPLAFTVDLKGTTEFGNNFGVNQLTQDGYTTGKLSGLAVSADGIITGRFSNGQTRNMGQVQLVTFQNPNGLVQLGANQWGATANSGSAQPNVPGSGILGTIQSGSVESSNVDLTAQLVDMITQQRAYQANAQSIKTADQLMQTLVNLR